MNYLDGFSGYGGFHLAFDNAGWEFDNVYFSEIDKYAIANYRHNFPKSIYAGSITTISRNTIPGGIDLFTFGWPCQDNSIAGKRKGQRDGTRSGLLYESVRVIDEFKPRNFVAENVAGLLTVNKGIDIVESLKVLAFLNENCPQYDIEMQLLNTRWVLPQNRERLYFVGHLRGEGGRQVFPIGESTCGVNEDAKTPVVRTITGGGNSGGYHSQMTLLRWQNKKDGVVESDYAGTLRGGNGSDGVRNRPVVKVSSATKLGFEEAGPGDSINFSLPNSETRRGRVGKGCAQTLDTECKQGVIAGVWRTHKDGNGFRPMAENISPTIPARARQDGSQQPVVAFALTEVRTEEAKRIRRENMRAGKDSNPRREKDIVPRSDDVMNTITASKSIEQFMLTNEGPNLTQAIRRLTPVECERLQGLPDNWTQYGVFDGIVKEISDTQRYKLCGNGVSEPIVRQIAQKLISL